MEDRKKRINDFAVKWLSKFQDKSSSCYDLAEDSSFGMTCLDLKIELDGGENIKRSFNLNHWEDVLTVLPQVTDIDMLASVIFSYWRYFNHWAYCCSEIDEERDWFIKTLTRLKELTNN